MNAISWLEGFSCLGVALSAFLPKGLPRKLAAGAGLAGSVLSWWWSGGAGEFLVPAAAGAVASLVLGQSGSRWAWLGVLAVVGGAVLSLALCILFPLPKLPPFQGPYRVATSQFEIPAVGDAPRLVVQFWYPTDEAAGRSPWLHDPELASRFPFHRLAKATVPIGRGQPVTRSGNGLKVLFYEHSWTGHRAENLAQVAELASRGFVVVAVDHPGQAQRVRYEDGSVVATTLSGALDLSSEVKVAEFLALAEKCLAERTRNLDRVLEALRLGAMGEVGMRSNLERYGVFGFSFGGSHALRLCARHPSFVAGANEDGIYLGEDLPRGAFRFFDSEIPAWLLGPAGVDESPEQKLIRGAEARLRKAMENLLCKRDIMDGVSHLGFSDAIFRSPVPRLSRTGRRPAGEIHPWLAGELADFFVKVLDPLQTQ